MLTKLSRPVIVVFLLGLLYFWPSPADAARPGVISGKIKANTATASSTYSFPNIVRAFQAVPPFGSISMFVPNGANYKLVVPAGGYVVLVQTWGGDSAGYKTSRKFVVAKAGKTVKLKARLAPSDSPLVALPLPAKSGGPDGPTISVGNVIMQKANGNPFIKFDGKPMTLDDVLLTDLAAVQQRCKFYVVEDREFGRFKDILKEIKLQASKYVDPKYRKTLKSSLQKLALWAPQYRLTGTIRQIDDFNAEADLRIIELSSGRVVWCRHMPFSLDNIFSSFPENVAAAIGNSICGEADLPSSIQGSFSGRIDDPFLGTQVNYSATASYLPTDPDPLHGKPSFTGIGQLTIYAASSVNISSWDLSGGSQCTYQAHDAANLTNPLGGNMVVEITPAECGERRYGFATAVNAPNPINVTVNCNGDVIEYQQPWGIALNSSLNYPVMSQFQGNSLTGNYTQGPVSFQWNMTAMAH